MSEDLLNKANEYYKLKGFYTLQEFIRSLIMQELNDEEDEFNLAGLESMGRDWFTKEEDEAWEKFQ